MTAPIAPARSFLPSSPPQKEGANALTAATTPNKRMAIVDRSKADPQMVEAAEGMEAMFLDYMMKVMRQTVPKNDMDLENPGTQIFQGMLDSEYAQKAARTGGIGLSDQIIAYLEAQRYTSNKGYIMDPAARQGMAKLSDPTDKARHTGGTHEGQLNNK